MYIEENMQIALWRIYAEIKSILRYIRYQPIYYKRMYQRKWQIPDNYGKCLRMENMMRICQLLH